MTQQQQAVDGESARINELPRLLHSFQEQGPLDDSLRKKIQHLVAHRSGEGIEFVLLDAFRSGVAVATVLRAHAAVAQAYQAAIDTVSVLVADSKETLVWLEHYALDRNTDGKFKLSSRQAIWNPATRHGLIVSLHGSHRKGFSPAESVFVDIVLKSLRLPGKHEENGTLFFVSDMRNTDLQKIFPDKVESRYAPSGEDSFSGYFPAGTHASEARLRFKAARIVDDKRRGA